MQKTLFLCCSATVTIETCLFVEQLLSNGCCTVILWSLPRNSSTCHNSISHTEQNAWYYSLLFYAYLCISVMWNPITQNLINLYLLMFFTSQKYLHLCSVLLAWSTTQTHCILIHEQKNTVPWANPLLYLVLHCWIYYTTMTAFLKPVSGSFHELKERCNRKHYDSFINAYK